MTNTSGNPATGKKLTLEERAEQIWNDPNCDCGRPKADGMNYCAVCLQAHQAERNANNAAYIRASRKGIPKPRCKECGGNLTKSGRCMDCEE